MTEQEKCRDSMAQQNQEITPVDPANLPLKRKRGRPRKHDYDNPSCQQHQRLEAVPAQACPIADSVHHSQVIPTRANSALTSSHGPNGLLGQAVCGTLDGTFDAGYLLTVRVANTGDVLKGLVFDPRLCIPVSAENDIAPLLAPVATPNGTSFSADEVPSETLVSVPVQAVPTSSAAPFKTVNQSPATSRLPRTAPQLSKNEAQVQASVPQTLPKSTLNDANQEPAPAASQQVVVDDAKAEDFPGLAAVNKETSQMILDVPSEDLSLKVIESLGVEQGMHQVKESSTSMVEASGANEKMHQTKESPGERVEAHYVR
ncbi:Mate efflux family protein [Musa troglodytarum]|uniref:Mate efflux family protein n=1 Tax=Musa troglodytarum TaxID=320322 RepID=A0A9E7ENW1_9LILI|nr:Mate efflux family protein [Musa troglodytarum]